MAAATQLDRPAEEFVNDVGSQLWQFIHYLYSHHSLYLHVSMISQYYFQSTIEELWAIKAFEHAEIYFNVGQNFIISK